MNLSQSILDIEAKILDYFRNQHKQPTTLINLTEALDLTTQTKDLSLALEDLENKGEIMQNAAGTYGLPKFFQHCTGYLSITSRGFGFVIPDTEEGKPKAEDIFITKGNLNHAMNQDYVLVKVTASRNDFRSHEGQVVRILNHANKKIVGTFQSSRTYGFVVPDDTRITTDIVIDSNHFKGATTGTKVVVEITKWPTADAKPEGKVIEVLGKVGDPGVDILSIMRHYDLAEEFPEDVAKEASLIETEPNPNEVKRRADRRNLPVVTIDGEDAKDLDDGVYAQQLENGNIFLGVYIADVSYYVKPYSPLDQEAFNRGNSVYLVDRVIPMLPVELSNGICSLNAGVERLAMACEMEINPQGKVVKYEILPVVIKVYRRLTYNLVNKILFEREKEAIKDNEDILTLLYSLKAVQKILRIHRNQRGAINFELPEVKVNLDDKGKPLGLVKREHGLGESIIEECMLIANETVAKHMATRELPFIYRIHEEPNPEKITALNNLLANFNLYLKCNKDGSYPPKEFQRVLNSVVGKPEEKIISSVALRSMQQAKYSPENLGHFGLAATFYTHFTSPIRRYPDLIVHRLLREQLQGKLTGAKLSKYPARLEEIAQHTSKQERIAIEAERETVLIKEVEYMSQFIGDEFDAIISGVTSFGIFVELDNGVEGLVHISTLINDYYQYIQDDYALVGERTGFRYRLGDKVVVVLAKTSLEDRSIDFIIKNNGPMLKLYKDIVAKPFDFNEPVSGLAAMPQGNKRSRRKHSRNQLKASKQLGNKKTKAEEKKTKSKKAKKKEKFYAQFTKKSKRKKSKKQRS